MRRMWPESSRPTAMQVGVERRSIFDAGVSLVRGVADTSSMRMKGRA